MVVEVVMVVEVLVLVMGNGGGREHAGGHGDSGTGGGHNNKLWATVINVGIAKCQQRVSSIYLKNSQQIVTR